MKSIVKDESMQDLIIPKYEVGCKRILLSDNYLPALIRDNVKIIPEGVN